MLTSSVKCLKNCDQSIIGVSLNCLYRNLKDIILHKPDWYYYSRSFHMLLLQVTLTLLTNKLFIITCFDLYVLIRLLFRVNCGRSGIAT